jgi:hypothetical protein
MHRTIKVLALTGVFAAAASVAGAAPSTVGQMPEGVSNGVVQVHGNHRSCRTRSGRLASPQPVW